MPFAAVKDGVSLAVRITPRADRNQMQGVFQGADGSAALHLRLAAPPVDGAADRALVAFLSDALGLTKSDITIRSGETGRLKILHLSGDSSVVVVRLSKWIELGQAKRP